MTTMNMAAKTERSLEQTIEGINDTDSNYIFKIVIIHENLATGVGASAIMSRLADHLKGEPEEMASDAWRFELLRHPELYDQATAAAIDADMIVVSTAHGNDLPAYVKDWLENVLPQKQEGRPALVVLLDWEQKMGRQLPPVGVYLRHLAEKSGLDFYWNGREWQPQFIPIINPSNTRVENDYVMFEEVLPRQGGARGWGIND